MDALTIWLIAGSPKWYGCGVRVSVVALALLLATAASADRLIRIPTGKKLLSDSYRLEFLAEPSRDRTLGWLGAGLGHSFDLELTGESFDSNRLVSSLDFSYNYLVPITDFMPGLSFGVQDALGVTEGGRGLYAAVTFRMGNYGEHNQDVPTELTVGFWSRREGVAFGGVVLPFSEHLKLLAEHDARHLTAGFELSPINGGSFRFLFRKNQVLIGLRVSQRF
ncbi:MAG: hypothetical protein IH945_01205 [Armatimonadetes bacterium]|nr:hypothetical protein [Armatimonadota bacterium]